MKVWYNHNCKVSVREPLKIGFGHMPISLRLELGPSFRKMSTRANFNNILWAISS